MPDMLQIPFNGRFLARLASGDASERPSVPAGVGDAYFATDTEVLSLANAAGDAWMIYTMGGAVFVGVKAVSTGTQTLTANSSATLINLAGTDVYDTHAFHDPSTNNPRLTVPAGQAGYYRITGQLYVTFDNGSSLAYGRFRLQIRQNVTATLHGVKSWQFDNGVTLGVVDEQQVTATAYLDEGDWVGMYLEKIAANANTDQVNITNAAFWMERIGS